MRARLHDRLILNRAHNILVDGRVRGVRRVTIADAKGQAYSVVQTPLADARAALIGAVTVRERNPWNTRATLLLFGSRRSGLVINYIAEFDARFAFVMLIVLVADDQLDPLRKILEVQRIVGVSVGGKPILAVDLLAIRGETREL